MGTPLRIGIAGLGTVGAATVQLLHANAELIERRSGRRLQLAAVSARDQSKPRDLPLGNAKFVADAALLADDPDIDVIVEVIGGAEGVAKTLVEAALAHGKSVVTANKALIAHHGLALARAAEKSGATLAFEAAVAGGIPIIKALRDGLAANHFTRVTGILNGTCNYILTQMQEQKQPFDVVLKEAQRLGYAEAEPSFDIDGIDTAHKIAILASLAFGAAPAIGRVAVEGIRHITLTDMEFAAELGFRIKLLGVAALADGKLLQRVQPCLVPAMAPLANVHGVYNAVVTEGDAVGRVFFEGRGAGGGPTASSIVADLMDIARGVAYAPFTLPAASLQAFPHASAESVKGAYYVRLSVTDRPGVLADVTGICRDERISVRSLIQHSHQAEAGVQVVLTTHETTESAMAGALARIAALPAVQAPPLMLKIEDMA